MVQCSSLANIHTARLYDHDSVAPARIGKDRRPRPSDYHGIASNCCASCTQHRRAAAPSIRLNERRGRPTFNHDRLQDHVRQGPWVGRFHTIDQVSTVAEAEAGSCRVRVGGDFVFVPGASPLAARASTTCVDMHVGETRTVCLTAQCTESPLSLGCGDGHCDACGACRERPAGLQKERLAGGDAVCRIKLE